MVESKDVTMQRIYLETMEEVLGGVNKVIIDSEGGGAAASFPICRCRISSGGRVSVTRRGADRRDQRRSSVASAPCSLEPRNEPAHPHRRRRSPLVATFFILSSALFTVHQTQQALVLQFGNPVRVISEPGLNIKVPFIQNVEFFERRVLDFDAGSVELVLGDQKRLVVDAFARYRITDPLRFRQSRRQRGGSSVAGSSRSPSRPCAACSVRCRSSPSSPTSAPR